MNLYLVSCQIKKIFCIHVIPTWDLIKLNNYIKWSMEFWILLIEITIEQDYNFGASKLKLHTHQ